MPHFLFQTLSRPNIPTFRKKQKKYQQPALVVVGLLTDLIFKTKFKNFAYYQAQLYPETFHHHHTTHTTTRPIQKFWKQNSVRLCRARREALFYCCFEDIVPHIPHIMFMLPRTKVSIRKWARKIVNTHTHTQMNCHKSLNHAPSKIYLIVA